MTKEPLIYVIAPSHQQMCFHLSEARIPLSRARFAGASLEGLEGIERGTVVYRVGGELTMRQLDALYGWVDQRFGIVRGLPKLDEATRL